MCPETSMFGLFQDERSSTNSQSSLPGPALCEFDSTRFWSRVGAVVGVESHLAPTDGFFVGLVRPSRHVLVHSNICSGQPPWLDLTFLLVGR